MCGEGAVTPEQLAKEQGVSLSAEYLSRLQLIPVDTVDCLAASLEKALSDEHYDVVIHAMAVLDYVPDSASTRSQKTKSGREQWTIHLVPSPKIIDRIKRLSPTTILVGFKLEAGVSPQALIASARQLMDRSAADLVIANDMADAKNGPYKAILLERGATEDSFITTEIQGRFGTALVLCDRLEQMLCARNPQMP